MIFLCTKILPVRDSDRAHRSFDVSVRWHWGPRGKTKTCSFICLLLGLKWVEPQGLLIRSKRTFFMAWLPHDVAVSELLYLYDGWRLQIQVFGSPANKAEIDCFYDSALEIIQHHLYSTLGWSSLKYNGRGSRLVVNGVVPRSHFRTVCETACRFCSYLWKM